MKGCLLSTYNSFSESYEAQSSPSAGTLHRFSLCGTYTGQCDYIAVAFDLFNVDCCVG
jgi:hypothetical protein